MNELDPVDEMKAVLSETLRANDLQLWSASGAHVFNGDTALDGLARGLLARKVAEPSRVLAPAPAGLDVEDAAWHDARPTAPACPMERARRAATRPAEDAEHGLDMPRPNYDPTPACRLCLKAWDTTNGIKTEYRCPESPSARKHDEPEIGDMRCRCIPCIHEFVATRPAEDAGT